MNVVYLLLCTLNALTSTACSTTVSKTCGLVGCLDQASLAIHPDDSPWMDGAYQLILQADNDTFTCSFRIPDALPGRGSLPVIDCTPKLSIGLEEDWQCTSENDGGANSHTCMKIADHYTLRAALSGMPASVAIALERDGSAQIDESVKPSYQDSYPNGPECGGACKYASLDFVF